MINLFSIYPEKKNSKWRFVFGFLFITLTLLITVVVSIFSDITKITINETLYGSLILVFMPSVVITLSGYLGAKFIPFLTSIGVLIGLIAMVFFLNKGHTLSTLVGSIVYIDLVLLFIGVSIVVELIYYLYSK